MGLILIITLIVFVTISLSILAWMITKRYTASKTKFFYNKTPFNEKIRDLFRTKIPKYSPALFLANNFLKFILSLKTDVKYEQYYNRKVFFYKDGGVASLEFYPKDYEPEIKSDKVMTLDEYRSNLKANSAPILLKTVAKTPLSEPLGENKVRDEENPLDDVLDGDKLVSGGKEDEDIGEGYKLQKGPTRAKTYLAKGLEHNTQTGIGNKKTGRMQIKRRKKKGKNNSKRGKNENTGYSKDTIVLFVPGLLSHSASKIVYRTVKSISKMLGGKIPIALLFKRGFNNLPITGRMPFSYANTSDFDEIIQYFKFEHKFKNIFLVGNSLGALTIQYYIGKKGSLGQDTHLSAAVCVSSPFDFRGSTSKIDRQKLIRNGILYQIKLLITEKYENEKEFKELLKEKKIEYERVKDAKSAMDLNHLFNAKANGFNTSDEFFKEFCANTYVDKISIPAFFLNSKKDPLVRIEDVKKKVNPYEMNKNIFQVIVEDGGHIEYPTTLCCKIWSTYCTSAFINLILESKEKGS